MIDQEVLLNIIFSAALISISANTYTISMIATDSNKHNFGLLSGLAISNIAFIFAFCMW